MRLFSKERKQTGSIGENEAEKYLKKHGFRILGKNIARKTGEIDILAQKGQCLHFVEVKTRMCDEFPKTGDDEVNPADNLHAYKIRKVARTAEWLVAERGWEGDWQVDGILVWIRRTDGVVHVEHLLQIL